MVGINSICVNYIITSIITSHSSINTVSTWLSWSIIGQNKQEKSNSSMKSNKKAPKLSIR